MQADYPDLKPKPKKAMRAKKEAKAEKDTKKATRLRSLVANMMTTAEDKSRPMTQNPTPKRLREYHSRLHDAANLERAARLMSEVADAIEAGTLPSELAGLKTKADYEALVYKGTLGGGYYEVI